MKLKAIAKELIKPSSPTPNNLQTIQLSVVDHLCLPFYVAAVFFYHVEDGSMTEDTISQKLKNSLSETLTRFYPLAGQIEGVSIHCNDKGAVFTEARADSTLSDFLRSLDLASLEHFLPAIGSGESPASWPLLHVQVSFFRSGGMAITVCVSHKICDVASLVTFVRAWAAATKGHADEVNPRFAESSIYPPADSLHCPSVDGLFKDRGTCSMKRFVFDPSKIAELKRKATSDDVPDPSRVEAIATLIWRCATKATRSNSTTKKASSMNQAMDLRLRIPSTENAIGNLQTSFFLKEGPESEMEIGEVVTKFRNAKEEMEEMIRENLLAHGTTPTLGEKLINTTANTFLELRLEMDIYPVTSWCRKPFYEADFGWGRPAWVAPGSHTLYKNSAHVILMDTKEGEGVEAWVCLPEQDMSKFEHDEEILAYATPNPCFLI
ncbi:PREDICTED: BAHD acyltransferase At5g47980-like [Tarenaya hassleriana]|uniref:BAHD acyltransferase At5g47980-like n=1 Tax=Tarenaya hassleriana TaxID=28532 RepID=UPI00053C42CD|nr:PREDICTED: BAHD acyltransferase At5g47980-like [Tarenaya hassleriana]